MLRPVFQASSYAGPVLLVPPRSWACRHRITDVREVFRFLVTVAGLTLWANNATAYRRHCGSVVLSSGLMENSFSPCPRETSAEPRSFHWLCKGQRTVMSGI